MTFNVPSIANSSSALTYLCWNSSTGLVTYDNSGTCLVSSLRYKHDVTAIVDPVGKLMQMDPIQFVYDDQSNQAGQQIGLSAESVAKAIPFLATYDKHGRPEKVKYIAMIGLLTAAVQRQEIEIERLERESRGKRHARRYR